MSSHLCPACGSVEPWQLTPEVTGSLQPPGDQAGTGTLLEWGAVWGSKQEPSQTDKQRSWKARKECNPWAKWPNWKLLTQELLPAGNSWSIPEEISNKRRKRKRKSLQAKHLFILFWKFYSHETGGERWSDTSSIIINLTFLCFPFKASSMPFLMAFRKQQLSVCLIHVLTV